MRSTFAYFFFSEILAKKEKRTPAAQESVHVRTMPERFPASKRAEKRKLAAEADM